MATKKEFYNYISSSSNPSVRLKDYEEHPATAFLKFAIDAKDAAIMCKNKFSKKKNGEYMKNALDSIHIINAGLLSAIMGNFETYQKYLFAQMFEYSIYLKDFKIQTFVKILKHIDDDEADINLELTKISAYRDNPIGVGLMLAYSLKGWQTTSRVVAYFEAFNLLDAANHKPVIYSDENKKDLSILWQMRHSIVHTAGTITIPDSQKIFDLNQFGGEEILLDPEFIPEVSRKLHKLVNQATTKMRDVYVLNLKTDINSVVRTKIDTLFEVKSANKNWLL